MTASRPEIVDPDTIVSLSPVRDSRSTQRPMVSVLVPAKDEAENLPLFVEQAAEAFAAEPGLYEVIVIDDGSTDNTWAILESLVDRYPFLSAVRHRAEEVSPSHCEPAT